MKLRTQLAVAFLLLAVVPLFGVTLYTWLGSQRAFRQAVEAGRTAYLAGLGPSSKTGAASSPLTGFLSSPAP